jgi:membrane-associated phospholipid phosphatase
MAASFFIFPLFLSTPCHSQDSLRVSRVPLSNLVRDAGGNSVRSLTYHYGLNYAAAGLLTYGMVESGLDWDWYRLSTDNAWIGNTGFASVFAGGLVPISVPLGLFLYGRFSDRLELQVTGLALGQAALLGLAISSGIKVFTGRIPPDDPGNRNDYSGKFQFGFWRAGAFDGWPSSHTAIAFAMSETAIRLYPDNMALKAGALTYAALIGLGVSTNIHWLSDAVAGAFIGYAIGHAVGTDFAGPDGVTGKGRAIQLLVGPGQFGVASRF